MRYCKQAGCPNLVTSGLCPVHKPKGRTGSRNPFYGSAAWKKLRVWQLAQEPLCRSCGSAGEVVDHAHEIKDGGDSLAVSNIQTLCRRCHEIKSDRFAGKVYDYATVQPKPINSVRFRF